MPKCTKTRHFHTKMRKFSGYGAVSLWGGDTPPDKRGHPSPYPTPQVLPLQLGSGYATVTASFICISTIIRVQSVC